MPRRALLCALLLPLLGCSDTREGVRAPLSPSTPTPVVSAQTHVISYRVQGTATHASITYTSSIEGTNTTSSAVPWVAQFTTTASNAYLYLSATSETGGTVVVQLFVDGVFLREAASDPLVLAGIATISGTFNLDVQAQ